MALKTAPLKVQAKPIGTAAKSSKGKSVQRKVNSGLLHLPPVVQRSTTQSWIFNHQRKKQEQAVQAKVNFHPANDHYEKEADIVADKATSSSVPTGVKITALPHRTVQSKINNNDNHRNQHITTLFRSADSSPPANAPPATIHPLKTVLQNQSTRGSPLPSPTRRQLEHSMGADFRNVRIHTGQQSHEASAAIGARAFTTGRHIHFAQGQYNPNTTTGRHLLAHELTHTIQQGASPTNSGRAPPVESNSETMPIQRSAVDDAVSYISEFLTDLPSITAGIEGAINWLRGKLRAFVSRLPGYTALGVVLGSDPITGSRVERNGRNFIIAALDIIPGGSLLQRKLQELGALDSAATWIDNQIATLSGAVENTKSDFIRAWNELGLTSILDGPLDILRNFGNIFQRGLDRLITFAIEAASQLLAIVKQFLLTQIVNFIRTRTNAYELLKVIIGRDPITDENVARNGTNILNALLEFGGEEGREQRRQMQDTGTFQKAADWIDTGISVFGDLYQTIRNNFGLIWNIVSIDALMHPIDTFNRIYETFAAPLRRVITFVASTLIVILRFIKEALMRRLSAFASATRGYPLVTVLIGRDPFTDQVVPRSIPNIIRGFMSLMEGGEEQYRQMEESGAIARTTQRINAAVARLNMTPTYIVNLFVNLWNSFSFRDLVNPIAAFRRIINCFGQPIARLIAFIVEIVRIVIEVIMQIMNFPTDLIANIINRAMAAIDSIKRDPIGFLKNLLRAIKQGFVQFFNNILIHLRNGLIGWLLAELRDANIPQPTDFSLRGIIAWALQVLGLSMETLWEKLAAHPRIGPERVARIRSMIDRLEGIWTFIQDVRQRGISAIWERIQEQLTNLWETIQSAIQNWIMERIVSQVSARLMSMLDPTGIMAVINGAMALYRAIQSFLRYLRQMLEVVNSFVNGVADIAAGTIATAANYLENTMGRTIPIIIGFLANQIGLAGIGRRIAEIITGVRAVIDRALTWLVNRVVNAGFAIFDRLMSMGRSAVQAVRGWLGLRTEFTADDGERHSLYYQRGGADAELILASTPRPIRIFLNDYISRYSSDASKADKITQARAALDFIRNDIVPLQRRYDAAREDAEKRNVETLLLQKFEQLSSMVRVILGRGNLNAAFDKYHLEGFSGTYASMPRPTSDQFTADHQPQAAVLEEAAAMPVFNEPGIVNMKNRAARRANNGYAINLHHLRHIQGRTYLGRGLTTRNEFLALVASRTAGVANSQQKRDIIVGLIRNELMKDVISMRLVARSDNPVYWSDLIDIKNRDNLSDRDFEQLRSRVRQQILAGEDQMLSQDLDSLKR